MLRVLAADEPLMLIGIRRALAAVDGIEVVGEASSSSHLLPLIVRTHPDVVLLGLELAGLGVVPFLQRVCSSHPEVRVMAISDGGSPSEIARVLEAGACGCVLKSIDPGDLAAAIRQCAQGTFFAIGKLGLRVSCDDDVGLSVREREIMAQLGSGRSNREIAEVLWVSDQTVKFHLSNIYRKLGVRNRTEAAGYAYRHGLSEVIAS